MCAVFFFMRLMTDDLPNHQHGLVAVILVFERTKQRKEDGVLQVILLGQ